jgi:hypothetical protein
MITALSGFGVGLLVARHPASSARATTMVATAGGAVVPVGPTRIVAGVPVGYRHDQPGAAAAAAGYVAATGRVATAGPIGRNEAVRAMATAGSAGRQLDAVSADLAIIEDQLGTTAMRALWVDAPITVTVADYTPESATARVWSVSVIGAAGGTPPQSVWRTSTLRLVWQTDDWKTDAIDVTPGPTPVGAATSLGVGSEAFATVAGWDLVAAEVAA